MEPADWPLLWRVGTGVKKISETNNLVALMILNNIALVCSSLLSVLTIAVTGVQASPKPERMNVVLLLVDDLGWTDVACFGSRLYQTPNIDRLAQQGVRFSNAYSPACSCSPSRAAIMTGKYPARIGMTGIVEKHRGDKAPDDAPMLPATTGAQLPSEQTTIAEVLQSIGYRTCLVGKWHLGDRHHRPTDHGFDVAIAPPHAGAPKSYFWPDWNGNPAMKGRFQGEYLTDRLADEASDFVAAHPDDPFFLCLSFHSVHVPIEAKADKLEKYKSLLRSRAAAGKASAHFNPYYAAMVESMDDGVGKVMMTLERVGVADKTLVIFFSDNGGLVHPSHLGEHTPATTNRPLRSGKGFLYEGGIRVPLIVHWPGLPQPGRVCTSVVHGCDLFPTICDAASVKGKSPSEAPRMDGISLLPVLRDPKQSDSQRTLFWHYPHFSSMGGRPSGAVRQGSWKLIEHFETGDLELFELETDIGESTNLAAVHPQRAAALHQLLKQWRGRMNALMPSRPNPNFNGAVPSADQQAQ